MCLPIIIHPKEKHTPAIRVCISLSVMGFVPAYDRFWRYARHSVNQVLQLIDKIIPFWSSIVEGKRPKTAKFQRTAHVLHLSVTLIRYPPSVELYSLTTHSFVCFFNWTRLVESTDPISPLLPLHAISDSSNSLTCACVRIGAQLEIPSIPLSSTWRVVIHFHSFVAFLLILILPLSKPPTLKKDSSQPISPNVVFAFASIATRFATPVSRLPEKDRCDLPLFAYLPAYQYPLVAFVLSAFCTCMHGLYL